MPSFDISVPDLQISGPIIQGFIGPSRELIATLDGDSVAAPISISALIDSGAAVTVITSEVASLLGLKSVGAVPLHTPTTIEPVICRQFHVNIYLSREFVLENVVVVEAVLTGQSFHCLIGRDILARGTFTYNGVENRSVLRSSV